MAVPRRYFPSYSVFAQIIGTIALMKPDEKKLIKGIIINRFRGDKALFESGVTWIEKETGIPVLGILPWLKEIFPPEDSLDLMAVSYTHLTLPTSDLV